MNPLFKRQLITFSIGIQTEEYLTTSCNPIINECGKIVNEELSGVWACMSSMLENAVLLAVSSDGANQIPLIMAYTITIEEN